MKHSTATLYRAGVWAMFVCVVGGLLLDAGVSAQEVLPRPEPPFKGKIGRTYKDSRPDKIPIIEAPAGAPNILIVLIDDVG